MWVVRHRYQAGPDVSAAQVSSEVHELHGWQSEDADVFDSYRAHLAAARAIWPPNPRPAPVTTAIKLSADRIV
jgi:hypothetical protein